MTNHDEAALPLTVIIFGATGDLTSHKLIPALFRLFAKRRLPPGSAILGTARSRLTDEQFRERLANSLQENAPGDWHAFVRQLHYVPSDATKPGGLDGLRAWLSEREGDKGGRRLYYLAVAPDLYPQIITALGETGMAQANTGWRRVVIEKPFGRDLASARALNRVVHQHFAEEQVYRIDHYLGKETVQNLLVFRFANTIFEPVWNHNFIDHVQITVAEKGTAGGRAGYYDHAGVLRDMFQSHILQVLTLVTMEAPAHFAAGPLRNEKVKVLDSMPVPSLEEAARLVVTGQYEGYRAEPGVAPESRTPTFAAARLQIDNWRWRGVPFYLRSGKGLAKRYTEINVQFLCPPHLMFPLPPGEVLQCNRLALTIQPNEGIHFSFQSKVPDTEGVELHPADLQFHYRDVYADTPIPDAYERLLQDAANGDAALFMRSDEIERAWEIMDPIIAATERPDAPPPHTYPLGSMGPKAADEFMHSEGRKWLELCHTQASAR
jgi:glucose-6-phosphate 1-dehydrogenase